MGCHDTFEIGLSQGIETLPLAERETRLQAMGTTALNAVKEYHPISERGVMDIVASAHGVSIEDAAYAVLRLGGTHKGDLVQSDAYGILTLP